MVDNLHSKSFAFISSLYPEGFALIHNSLTPGNLGNQNDEKV